MLQETVLPEFRISRYIKITIGGPPAWKQQITYIGQLVKPGKFPSMRQQFASSAYGRFKEASTSDKVEVNCVHWMSNL